MCTHLSSIWEEGQSGCPTKLEYWNVVTLMSHDVWFVFMISEVLAALSQKVGYLHQCDCMALQILSCLGGSDRSPCMSVLTSS